ncbi:methyltransferase [Embleya sp. AB8]|uniref:methyltransferase n=1 Tax=Embleya sp. AB8 TaxID=3156304 RepID=UPI003C78B204
MTADISTPPPTPTTTAPSPEHLTQLALAFTAAKCLLSAVEIGVFTELARHEGPDEPDGRDEHDGRDAADLAARLDLHPRGAAAFLDALVGLGLLDRHDGRYRNTPETDHFLDRAKPTAYIGDGLDMANSRLYGFWGRLTDALRTGEPRNELAAGHGERDPFAEIYADPARRRLFQRAMSQLSRPAMLALVERFPWAEYRRVADIGCGDGALLCRLADRHPLLTGVGFDLPASADAFTDNVGAAELIGRVAFQPGDFRIDPLPDSDVLVLGHVLHDWDLPTKRLLLAKAHAALPEGGALILFESFLDDERRANVSALLLGLNTLIETPGGFACTVSECRELLVEAGFRSTRTEPLTGAESMVVGVK